MFSRVDTLERDVSTGPGRYVSRAPGQLETAGAAATAARGDRGQLASHPALLSWSRVNSGLDHRTSKSTSLRGIPDQNSIKTITKCGPELLTSCVTLHPRVLVRLVTSSGQ